MLTWGVAIPIFTHATHDRVTRMWRCVCVCSGRALIITMQTLQHSQGEMGMRLHRPEGKKDNKGEGTSTNERRPLLRGEGGERGAARRVTIAL